MDCTVVFLFIITISQNQKKTTLGKIEDSFSNNDLFFTIQADPEICFISITVFSIRKLVVQS